MKWLITIRGLMQYARNLRGLRLVAVMVLLVAAMLLDLPRDVVRQLVEAVTLVEPSSMGHVATNLEEITKDFLELRMP